jgi:ribulose-phosphate 3-epimerase
LPSVLPKLRALRELIEREGLSVDLEIDGGIAPSTVRSAVEAGANVLVAGTAVFGEPDRRKAIAALRAAVEP